MNFNEILNKNYEETKEEIFNDIKKDIETRKEIVTVIIDDVEYEMNKGNLLSLLILAKPFVTYKEKFTEEFLIDPSDINDYENYFDKIIKHFINKDINVTNDIMEIINNLIFLSNSINYQYGSSISLKSIIDLSKRNDEFNKLMNMKINENEDIEADKIMELTNKNLDRMVEILKEDEDNILHNYLQSGAGINIKQLGQVLSYVALKPDFNETIIPKPINTSFARGLNNVVEYFINAIGARKSLITSHHQVRSSGYLTRQLSLLMIDNYINDEDDCGSVYPIPLFIKNNKTISALIGRYCYLNKSKESEEFSYDPNEKILITEENKEEFIGKSILLRSPITCACKSGICKTCYGELSKINKDYNIGIIACLLITNPLTQRLLSSKHLLQANIDKIEWSDDVNKYFNIVKNQFILKEKAILTFNKEDIEEEDDKIIINAFKINDTYIDDLKVALCLHPDYEEKFESFLNQYEDDVLVIKDFEPDDTIFYFIIENNGLSASLIEIKSLIEKNVYINNHGIIDVYQYFVSLIEKSGIKIDYVHIELILKEMLFLLSGDRTEFADIFNVKEKKNLYTFSDNITGEDIKNKLPPYKIYNISNSIQYNSKSVSKTLLFEQIYKQLTTDSYHTLDKCNKSIMDELLID